MDINILDLSIIVIRISGLFGLFYILAVLFQFNYPTDYFKIASRIVEQHRSSANKSSSRKANSLWNACLLTSFKGVNKK